jgi:hypothetical protein
MIICNLVGGLGNQMFQYACARALSLYLKAPLKFTTDVLGASKAHNGFELNNVFGLKLEIASGQDLARLIGWGRSLPVVRRALAKRPFSWLACRGFLGEPHFRYWPSLIERARQGGYMQGYWQSELYFSEYSARIRNEFSFKEDLKGANLQIAHAILRGSSISLHIRHGDYVSNSKTLSVHGTCSPEYYYSAIETLLQRCPDARLFAFSDDPQWVLQVLKPRYPDLVLVDHNKGKESYNDMRLMSMCNHHIIANSSFSWWGAWLNSSPDKMVIVPSRWFADGRDTRDLIPAGWKRI